MTLFGQTLDGEQVFGLISLLCMLGLWLVVLKRERGYARWFRQWEADRKARRDAEALGFHNAITEAAAGTDVQTLVKWGKDGGYTPAQRKKFNADINSSDPEVAAAAVALLKQRYDRANPPRQGVRPQRDATANAGRKPTGVEGFKSQAEYRAANKEARNSGDQRQLDLVRKRLKASSFYKSGG